MRPARSAGICTRHDVREEPSLGKLDRPPRRASVVGLNEVREEAAGAEFPAGLTAPGVDDDDPVSSRSSTPGR